MNIISNEQTTAIDRAVHRHLLSSYQAKTSDGSWNTLIDDGYIYPHLTWHLEQAQCWDAIHTLLQETASDGRNAWYQTCIKYGYFPTYIQDIQRAWRLLEQARDENNAVGVDLTLALDKPTAIALQVRYAATLSVLNSLVNQIPAPLIVALVTQQLWTFEQAWTLMEQSLPSKQVEILECLVQHVPDDVEQHQALDAVLSVPDESARARMLLLLAPILSEARLIHVLEHSAELTSEHYRSLVLCHLSDYLPSRTAPRVLTLASEINDQSHRVTIWSYWVQHQISLLPDIFAALKSMQEPDVLNQVLITIAPHLPAHFVPPAVQLARSVDEPEKRYECLRALAIYRPSLQSEVIALARHLEDEFTRASALASLAADGAFENLEEILPRIRQIEDEAARTLGLRLIAPHLPEIVVPKLLQEIQQLHSESHRIQILKKIPLSSSIIPQVLHIAAGFENAGSLATVLIALARVEPTLMSKALQAAQQIEDLQARASTLGQIAIDQPALWSNVLDTVRQIPDEWSRATVLRHLAPHLPELYIASALDLVAEISALPVRSQVLSSLAMYLPQHLLRRALGYVLEVPDLSGFASVAQQFEPTQASTHSCINRASAVNALVSYIPEELLEENSQVIEHIDDPKLRAHAVSGLLSQLTLDASDTTKLSERLHCLASRCHPNFLADLLKLGPAIAYLGGPECLSTIAQHLKTLESQWGQCSIPKSQLK